VGVTGKWLCSEERISADACLTGLSSGFSEGVQHVRLLTASVSQAKGDTTEVVESRQKEMSSEVLVGHLMMT
jgi:hypothetical protein